MTIKALGIVVVCATVWPTVLVAAPNTPVAEHLAEQVTSHLASRLAVAAHTSDLITKKISAHREHLRRRIAAAYRLSRLRGLRWSDKREQQRARRLQTSLRGILTRSREEQAVLAREHAFIAERRTRLHDAQRRAKQLVFPAARSLARPVQGEIVRGFGLYRRHGVQLFHHGVLLRAKRGNLVRCVAKGEVIAVEAAADGETIVVVRHDDYLSAYAGLSKPRVAVGQRVVRRHKLGVALSARLYVEIRADVGDGGVAVDPAPLLRVRQPE